MKRLLCLILAFSILLLLPACYTKSEQPTPDTTAENTDPTSTEINTDPTAETETATQIPMISISVPIAQEHTTAENGATIFTSCYNKNISMIVSDPEVADKIIIDILNRIDPCQQNITEIKYSAATKYNNSPDWTPYLNQITFDPMRIDSSILSLLGKYTVYNGDIHPETAFIPVTYDLLTGSTVGLRDIFTEAASSETISKLVIEALQMIEEEKRLYKNYAETVTHRFETGELEYDGGWFFSPKGLCYYFSPYDIAPYVSGIIIAEIPYSQLTGIIKDEYFPPERESATGTIKADIFQEDLLKNFDQFSEIVLTEGGQKILLHTDAPIYDLRLETGTWTKKGKVFTPTNTLFAAYGLGQGDAIMVEGDFEADVPTLRLSYTTGDKTIYAYITANNSSVTLTEYTESKSA